MRTLYPPIEPYDSGLLDVGDGQRIYWEGAATRTASRRCSCTAGPAAAAPPTTAGCSTRTRYRVVLFDQRGCGRSTPHASRLAPTCSTTPPGTWSPTWSGCAARWASSAGWCSAGRGAAPWRWPTPRRTPSGSANWSCAASSRCGARSCTGSTSSGASLLFPDAVGAVPRADPRSRAGRPDRAPTTGG